MRSRLQLNDGNYIYTIVKPAVYNILEAKLEVKRNKDESFSAAISDSCTQNTHYAVAEKERETLSIIGLAV